jgi:hypothetical protein
MKLDEALSAESFLEIVSDPGSNLSVLFTMNDGYEIKYLLARGSILIF